MVVKPPSISDVFLLWKKNHGLSAKLLVTLLLTEKKVYNVLAKGQTRKWTF